MHKVLHMYSTNLFCESTVCFVYLYIVYLYRLQFMLTTVTEIDS